jgi:uncharacterized protein (UPF0276 family)
MKFAVNYSNALIKLLQDDQIQVDLIKCPDWAGMIKEAKLQGPITIHFDLDVGLGNSFNVDFNRVRRLADETFTPHVNTHLVTPKTLNPDNIAEVNKLIDLWHQELQFMIDGLGSCKVALEHFPYTKEFPNLIPAVDIKIFSNLVETMGVNFLLDLSHARITADTKGMDVKTYIEGFPLDRLVELHFTGVKQHGGILTDHFEMMDEDWDLLKWALQEIQSGQWQKPEVVAFEYGGVGSNFAWRTNDGVLATQVPQLYQLISKYKN